MGVAHGGGVRRVIFKGCAVKNLANRGLMGGGGGYSVLAVYVSELVLSNRAGLCRAPTGSQRAFGMISCLLTWCM